MNNRTLLNPTPEQLQRSLRPGALLLTGATGLVGGGLVPLLKQTRPERDLVILARNPAAVRLPDAYVVQADLTSEELGLSPALSRILQDRVTEVVHSAADIRFRISLEESRLTNVTGTERMLAFAENCRHLDRFLHVSTIYIAGKSTGVLPESPVETHGSYVNVYQQTKHEAEALAVQAMSRLPLVVARLSSLIGSSCGRVQQFNYFHQLIKAIPWNPLPAIPADPDARIDMAASDWTVKALHHLYETRFEPGRVYQLCAGPERSWSVSRLMDSTYDVFERHHPALRLKRRPKMVPFEEFDRVLSRIRNRIPAALDEWLEALFSFLPHLTLRQQFANEETEKALGGTAPFPSLDSYFHEVVDYCLASNWGRAS